MLTEDNCPWDICVKLRDSTRKLKFINLDCFYCISVVIALGVWAVGSLGFYEAIAMAGLAIFWQLIHERLDA